MNEENPPKLTKRQLSQSRIIAKGRRIRDLDRLLETYGGTAQNWLKKSSPPLLVQNRPAEIHWYEHQGLGRVEEKIKWLD